MKNSLGSGLVQEEKPIHEKPRAEVHPGKSIFSRISPSAKVLITEHGLDLSSLRASGAHGTLLKADVLAAIRSGKVSPRLPKDKKPSTDILPKSTAKIAEASPHVKQSDSFEDLPNSQIRKV